MSFSSNDGSQSIDQTTLGGPSPGYRVVPTTEVSESFSALSTIGWLMMKNLDTTNYVEWGFSTGVYGGRMEAGETALFRVNPSSTIYLRANTDSCKLTLYALED